MADVKPEPTKAEPLEAEALCRRYVDSAVYDLAHPAIAQALADARAEGAKRMRERLAEAFGNMPAVASAIRALEVDE